MKNVKVLLLILFIITLAGTSCEKNYDDYNFEPDEQGQTTDPNQTNNNEVGEEGTLTLYKIADNEIIKVKDFNVPANLKSFQADTEKHKEMWAFFKKLIPENERRFITEFEVFHGGGGLAGFVAPVDENDLSRWKLGLAIDLADDIEKVDLRNEFTYISIHEYGHILTLNNTQVDVNQSNCNNFHTGEGCAKTDSYIQRIYELGWDDIINEFRKIDNEDDAYDFYLKYKDRFVTDYAATNPGEDVAEVFSVFVTQDSAPTGNTIADQKVLAMYNFPELVQLRNTIRTQPALRALKPGSWVKQGKRKMCKHKSHRHDFAVSKN